MLKVFFMSSLILNAVFLYSYFFPEGRSLADIAINLSSTPSKDYEGFYSQFGPPYNDKMTSITGDKISFIYDKDNGDLFLYGKSGPILSYAADEIYIYSESFDRSFYDRAESVASYNRVLNVLSIYSGKTIKVGFLNQFPEISLSENKKTSDDITPFSYVLNDSKLEEIYKDGRACKFLGDGQDDAYFACCPHTDQSKKSIAEGFVYLPYNNNRWVKTKGKASIKQDFFDTACNELYKSDVILNKKLREKLSHYFLNLDIDGFIKELGSVKRQADDGNPPKNISALK